MMTKMIAKFYMIVCNRLDASLTHSLTPSLTHSLTHSTLPSSPSFPLFRRAPARTSPARALTPADPPARGRPSTVPTRDLKSHASSVKSHASVKSHVTRRDLTERAPIDRPGTNGTGLLDPVTGRWSKPRLVKNSAG